MHPWRLGTEFGCDWPISGDFYRNILQCTVTICSDVRRMRERERERRTDREERVCVVIFKSNLKSLKPRGFFQHYGYFLHPLSESMALSLPI